MIAKLEGEDENLDSWKRNHKSFFEEEGKMHWIRTEELDKVNLVSDFKDLLEVMLDENLSEFQYVVTDNRWNIIKK